MRYNESTEVGEMTKTDLPLFNKSVLDEYYGGVNYPGAVDIFIDCSNRMLQSLSERLRKISEAGQSENFAEIIYCSHQLKGSFNATGSPLLAEVCDEIGRHAKEKNIENCRTNIVELLQFSYKFVDELQSFIATIEKH